MDAIEAGIVKVARVRTRESWPVKSRYSGTSTSMYGISAQEGARQAKGTISEGLPATLEAALHALYRDYEGRYHEWMSKGAETPPVFIVVANNTATSKLI